MSNFIEESAIDPPSSENSSRIEDGSVEEEAGAFLNPEDVLEEYDIGDEPQELDGEEGDDYDMEEGDEDAEEEDLPAPVEVLPAEDISDVTFSSHTENVYCVAINPVNPMQFMTGGGDDRGFLWQISGEAAVVSSVELKGHTDTVSNVGFSADGTLAATAGFDGKIKIWSAATGEEKMCLEGPEDIEWMTWHGKGNVILAGSLDSTVWMWFATTGECMRVFAGHEGRVNCGAFTCDGKAILTGGEDGSLRVWGPKNGECRHVFRGHGFHEGAVTCLAAYHDQEHPRLVLTGSEDGTARLVHTQSKKVLSVFPHSREAQVEAEGSSSVTSVLSTERPPAERSLEGASSVETVGFSYTHPWCASGGADGVLKIWDMTTNLCRQTCAHRGAVTKLQWHRLYPRVFTSCADGVVRAWDALTGTCVREFTGHTDMVLDFALYCGSASTEDRQWLASASDDGTCKIFTFSSADIGIKTGETVGISTVGAGESSDTHT